MTHGMCYQGVAYICLKSWESTIIIITLIIKHRGVNYPGMRMDVYLYFEYFFPIKKKDRINIFLNMKMEGAKVKKG